MELPNDKPDSGNSPSITTDSINIDTTCVDGAPVNQTEVVKVAQADEDIEELSQLITCDKSQIISLMRDDMDVAAGIAFGDLVTSTYPPIFKAIWELLTSSSLKTKDFSKLAIGLPRGFGKTTVIKLFLFWLVLFSKKRYMLITASNQTKADRILADVRRLFNAPSVRAIFGNILYKCETDRSDLLIFTYNNRLITLQALGSGGDPRGSNIGMARPDIILSDDIQSRDNAFSPTQANALRDWYYATLMPAKSELGCLFIYIGNMFPTDSCLLKEFRDSADWTSFITGAILADGNSIWEEFYSTEQLLKDLEFAIRNGNTNIYFSEILNDSTASGNTLFDPEKLLTRQDLGEVDYDHQGSFIVIDPAGAKKNSNDTAIGVANLIDGVPYLKTVYRGILTPLETITKAIDLASSHQVGLICCEDYAYQSSLLFWFQHICTLHGIYGIEFRPINRGSTSKNTAIVSMFTQLEKREIGLYSGVVGEVLTDIVRFSPQTTNNKDDLLDILVYLPRVVLKYRENIGRLYNSQILELEGDATRIVSEDFNCPI